jgi:hypothetical protein
MHETPDGCAGSVPLLSAITVYPRAMVVTIRASVKRC